MSHQDTKSIIVVNHKVIKQVADWILPPTQFRSLRTRAGATWKPRMLTIAAMQWSITDRANLTDRFEHARKIVDTVFRWQPSPGKTYQGFIKALRKRHAELLPIAISSLRTRMPEALPESWLTAGRVVFAVDGSRVKLPRTESLEQVYSPQNKKKRSGGKAKSRRAKKSAGRRKTKKQSAAAIDKKKDSPQMWLTLLWHVGTGLPWAWRSGPSDSSERGHLLEMLDEMPENALLTADAGFIGFEFWKTVLDAGHDFVIRVGANVKLLKELGYTREHAYTVYLWPDKAAKNKVPPIVLRLIEIHDGKQPVYLVTNLSKSQLSDRHAIEIYRCRWGIEVFFRTFKQTFGRTKLRSHSAENAKLELDWSLVGLWSVCLLGQRELVRSGKPPSRLSAANAIRAVQTVMRDYRLRPKSPDEVLFVMLARATLDDYERHSSKTSRNYPRQKQRTPPSPPRITEATRSQITAAKEVKDINANFRFTA